METRIIVIGGGPGGYVAAIRAAQLGAKVTLVEKEYLGGTCLNWGCIPSKIMKNSAEMLEKCQRADQFGIEVHGKVTLNISALMEKKTKIIETQRKGLAAMMKNHQVKIEQGVAKILSSRCVEISSKDGSKLQMSYDKLIIAAGAKPLNVPAFPFDHNYILSSDDLLKISEIPPSIVIVGGGVIGCEFACIFSALGVEVTVVEAMSRFLPMPSVDQECSKVLIREMKKRKIKVLCDTIVTAAVIKGKKLYIKLDVSPFTDNLKPKKLKHTEISAHKMAICIGRTSLAKDLGLENIALETSPQGWISTNEKLETSAQGVYAVGDILGPEKVMLAHVASREGMVAAQNAMGKQSDMNYHVIPGAIFTMPEIGTVGLSEIEAVGKGFSVESFRTNFRTLGKAQAMGEFSGMAKMIIEKESKRVLGVHMIGAHATDLIAEAALAIQKKMTAEDIAITIHAHPTLAEIMGELSLKASGVPIHG